MFKIVYEREDIMEKYIKFDGIEIYTKKDLVEEPYANIIINHGFAEHCGRYDYVAKRLNESNLSVFRYDLRGHGRTKGPKGHVDNFFDFIDDLDFLVERILYEYPNTPLYMLGHSMGGLITCIYGIVYKDKLEGQIFSGPAVLPAKQAKGIMKLGIKVLGNVAPNKKIKNVLKSDICTLDSIVEDYQQDPLNLNYVTTKFLYEFIINGTDYVKDNISSYTYPCLILHGEEDNIISKDASMFLYNNISSKDKDIKIYSGLYHEILNEKERDVILKDIINWIYKK